MRIADCGVRSAESQLECELRIVDFGLRLNWIRPTLPRSINHKGHNGHGDQWLSLGVLGVLGGFIPQILRVSRTFFYPKSSEEPPALPGPSELSTDSGSSPASSRSTASSNSGPVSWPISLPNFFIMRAIDLGSFSSRSPHLPGSARLSRRLSSERNMATREISFLRFLLPQPQVA